MAIHVIGLGARASLAELHDLLTSSHIAARSRRLADPLLPEALGVTMAFDEWFEGEIEAGLTGRIASELMRAANTAPEVVYLVPGSGITGDATVEALARCVGLTIHAGRHSLMAPAGKLQVVDALALAEAELDRPFDAGIAPLDSQLPVLVTNLYGPSIIELARERLRRTHPAVDAARADSSELYVEATDSLEAGRSLSGFEQIIARLRSPDGCPWDRDQTAASLHPQLLEEVEELGEAIESDDARHIAEELGDVLLHVVMIAQIAREEGDFDLHDVIAGVSAKMVRRHPHVFGDVEIGSIEELYENWDRIKAAEKMRSGGEL